MIDLRSDTVTRPSEAMRKAMYSAALGDDVFSEDPTVNRLEERLAKDLGKESALFCASGTMANQIAIKVHTNPGDQVICSWAAHIYNYEGGGMAMNSGVTAKLLEGGRGLFTDKDVESVIQPEDVHLPHSRLVSIEDTSNKGGGAIWPIENISSIAKLCQKRGLALHLDGARLYNRFVADQTDKLSYASNFDSVSICLSKGLGTPVGSVLVGSSSFIHAARRVRKVFGGGMRQAGVLAAAGLYALDHNVTRLAEDHTHAKQIAAVLADTDMVAQILPVETNIIVFHLKENYDVSLFIKALEKRGILAFATGPSSVRFVLHLDVTSSQIEEVIVACKDISMHLLNG